jgi:simple sugar transport system ATP-binding protein
MIRNKLVELRDNGTAVFLVSADLNEVLSLSDSIVVMVNGEIVAYFENTEELTEEILGEYMLGIKRQTDEEIAAVAGLDDVVSLGATEVRE